jgi:biofilm protein TabA
MILDKIENLARYQTLHAGIKDAANAIASGLPSEKKFTINGELVWGLNLQYKLRTETEPLWEAHRKHLDFHMVMKGDERIDICDIANTTPTTEFDDAGDYQLFTAKKEQTIILKPGYFMILFPNEVHRVGVIADSGDIEISKVVLKLKI